MSLEAWSLARPWGLAALVLPLLLILASWLPQRPLPTPTGTFELWRRLAGDARGGGQARRLPLSRWLLVLALACGACALAGPRPRGRALTEHWTVVVDRSPSMYLPAPQGAGLRIEAAWRRAAQWLADRSQPARLTFVCTTELGQRRVRAETLPAEWRTPPRVPAPETSLARWDRAGVLLLTDRASADPERAGLFAAGAEPVPGPIADRAREQLVFDGASVSSVPRAARWIRVRELPPVLAEFVGLWAQDRGFLVAGSERPAQAAAEPPALDIALAPVVGELRELSAGRDGWQVDGRGASVAPLQQGVPLEAWLAQEESLVAWAPGIVRVGFVELAEPTGDPVAFALSWARLLDEALLAGPDVLPLEERRAVGATRFVVPRGQVLEQSESRAAPAASRATPEVLLAAASALCAVLSRLMRGS